jgi:hypothetical protein
MSPAKRKQRESERGLCLYPPHAKVGRMEIRRGLCSGCYHAACRLVRDEKTTWRSLESFGKCKPLATNQNEREKWFFSHLIKP